ncbi:MAG: hypothetical protein ACE5G0_13240 [Rhodothermales bacterium]
MSQVVKWEYCALRANINDGKKFLKYFAAGKPSSIEDIHRTMAELGQEGWELVSLAQISQPDARVYYFKRPLRA